MTFRFWLPATVAVCCTSSLSSSNDCNNSKLIIAKPFSDIFLLACLQVFKVFQLSTFHLKLLALWPRVLPNVDLCSSISFYIFCYCCWLLARPSGVLFDGRHFDMLRPRATENASSQQHLSLCRNRIRDREKEIQSERERASSMRATGSHIAARPHHEWSCLSAKSCKPLINRRLSLDQTCN